MWIANAGDGTDRLFVVSQLGVVLIAGKAKPFLDLIGSASPPPNMNFISIAFPPHYDSKAYFYLSYGSPTQSVTVAQYTVLHDPDAADAESGQVVGVYQACRNGGQLVFGADGTLYLNAGGPIVSGILPGMTNDLAGLNGKMIPLLNENGPLPTNQMGEVFWPFGDRLTSDDCTVHGGVFGQDQSNRMSGAFLYGDASGNIQALMPGGTNWQRQVVATPTITWPIDIDILNPTNPNYELRPFQIAAFGQGEDGRIYVANYGTKTSYLLQTPYYPYSQLVTNISGGGVYLIEDDLSQFSVRPSPADANTLRLEWHSTPALNYQIQVSSDLKQWFDATPVWPGTGDILTFTNVAVAGADRNFFRVIASPP